MSVVETPPVTAADWVALSGGPLPLVEVGRWLVRPDCGAIVQFSGTARDHSEGRVGVGMLSYEAYEAEAAKRMGAVRAEIRRRWPQVVALAVLHRTGDVAVGEPAVHVGVSAPHRDAAFEAARYGIDAIKATVPIWKREHHSDGIDWGVDGNALSDPRDVVARWSGETGSVTR